jgi:hypothetical protein
MSAAKKLQSKIFGAQAGGGESFIPPFGVFSLPGTIGRDCESRDEVRADVSDDASTPGSGTSTPSESLKINIPPPAGPNAEKREKEK